MYAIIPIFLARTDREEVASVESVWPVLPEWDEWPAVTLVQGAWGTGKTAWLSQALRRHTAVSKRIAWVHLTPLHDMPHVFWSAVITALQTVDPQLGTAAQLLLKSVLLVPHLAFVNLLKTQLDQQSEPLVLVLDNCEQIQHEGLLNALAFLADELPDSVRLVLIANQPPALSLVSVAARGDLWHILPTAFPESVTPDISRLSPAAQALLAQTRPWPWLSTELITAAHGTADHPAWTELLEAKLLQPVLVNQQAGYYIYLQTVVAETTAVLADSHVVDKSFSHRATLWLVAQEAWFEACEVALAAGLGHVAADLLEKPQLLPRLLARGAYDLALHWGTAVAEPIASQRPLLTIYLAWACLHQGKFEQADAYTARAEAAMKFVVQHGVQELMVGYLATVRTIRGYLTEQYSATLAYAHLALENLPTTAPNVRAYVSVCLADAYRSQGNYPAARDAFKVADQLFNPQSDPYLVSYGYILQARLWHEWGHLRRAADFYEKVIADLRYNEIVLESPLLGEAYLGLGQLLYEQNELTAAYKAITYALMLLEDRPAYLIARLEAYLILGRVYAALDEMPWARQTFNHVLTLVATADAAQTPHLTARAVATRATAIQAGLDLQTGQVAEAEEWAVMRGLGVNDLLTAVNEELYLVYARVLIAQGKPFVALRLLKRILDDAQAAGRTAQQIGALTGQALALATQGHPVQAITKLSAALALGQSERFIRLFIDDGEPMAALLQELATAEEGAGIQNDYIQTLLDAAVNPVAAALNGVALPAVEADILAYLADSQWAADRADRAIQMHLAEATLAWHEHRLCHRFGVPVITAVVRRAQQLGWISVVPE